MARPVRRRGDGFEIRLSEDERKLVKRMAGELRTLLENEDPSSDEGVARLFPPAYPDDLLQNLDYERTAASGLLGGRLEAIVLLERTLEATILREEELLAWLRIANDLRLVLGTRLGVTEETSGAEFKGDDERRESYALYIWLTWLVDGIVREL
jgi:Domain of unknown function (DUF2017)